MTEKTPFETHLESGLTTLCRCWAVTRRDGTVLGFTDHDLPLLFEGIRFKANSGLTASALAQGTGLSVDNSEALGALSDSALRAKDIEAGRYDGATVRAWLVNWANVDQRILHFSGSIGEISRQGGAFQAELRGLTDLLGVPGGRMYHRACGAVLGDAGCGVDLSQPEFSVQLRPVAVFEGRKFHFTGLGAYAPGWFERGTLRVEEGEAFGLGEIIKRDGENGGMRVIELWEPIPAEVAVADLLRLEAGCDKRAETCRTKFGNFVNYQGFPDIPGDDWLVSLPSRAGAGNGGSRR